MKEDKPFHKTAPGKVFLSLLAIIVLFLLTFGVRVLYLSYQINYGDEEKKKQLAKKYGEGFSKSKKLTNSNAQQQKNIKIEKVETITRDYNPKFGFGDQVTIIAFLDFECPFCREQYPILKEVMKKYKPAIQVVFKHFPLASIHPHAKQASLAATCAQEQDKFWKYYNRLFKLKQFSKQNYYNIASDLSLQMEKFKNCYENQKYIKRVEKDLADGVSLGVRGTPTFIINGKVIQGVLKKEKWKEIILKEIKNE